MAKPRDNDQEQSLQARLGGVVRTCRSQLGITQEELAWRAGMHRTYLADIERGVRNVTLKTVANLASGLQVTVESLISDAAARAWASEPITPESAFVEPGEILLVEDNREDAALARRAFKRARVTNPFHAVSDAETALDVLHGTGKYTGQPPRRPQMILLDLNLPGMSGLDFLRRIKGDDRTSAIPVVILTVSWNDRMILECSRLGVENYIFKPVAVGALVSLVPKLNVYLTFGPLPATRGRATTGS